MYATAAWMVLTDVEYTHLMLVMAEETRNSAQAGIMEVRIMVLAM